MLEEEGDDHIDPEEEVGQPKEEEGEEEDYRRFFK